MYGCSCFNILAKSPMPLEDQCMVEHGVYVDIEDTEWVKCLHASHHTTLPA